MWVAVLLAGWLVTSLLMGPWIGRFVASHAKIPEEPLATNQAETQPAKPMGVARRA